MIVRRDVVQGTVEDELARKPLRQVDAAERPRSIVERFTVAVYGESMHTREHSR